MKFLKPVMMIVASLIGSIANGQTLYVDATNSNDKANGSREAPFASLEKAITHASRFSGDKAITIKVAPGLYSLKSKLLITFSKSHQSSVPVTIEAMLLPDDTAWTPQKMPIIQSISDNNNDPNKKFPHCVGLLIAANNVTIKGLKFLGNANPAVQYYYPIKKEDTTYSGLKIEQCYFVGDKNGTPIQGAVWVHGPETSVKHCIFYGCKNALLLFRGIKGFSFTNSIVYGAYEAAVWFGPFDAPFIFRDNIISGCNFFWLRAEDTYPAYIFSNSYIGGNKNYMGVYRKAGEAIVSPDSNIIEKGINKSGSIILNEVALEGIKKGYLHLSPKSEGYNIPAGIF